MKRLHALALVDDLASSIAWEHFHTLGEMAVFNEKPRGKPVGLAVAAAPSCC